MSTRALAPGRRRARTVDVSVVMPCLNEAETLAACIRTARAAIDAHELSAEIIVADNGSTDGSPDIAEQLGARVVHVTTRGYGAALDAGIRASRGRYIVMADADRSYDFAAVPAFVKKLREGYDLVMGNRFQGSIERGAMPWLHYWLGNPLLSRVGKLFFGARVGDFHCGIRAVSSSAYERLRLSTTGMEFASEMVIRASLEGMRVAELPVTLSRDGRTRRPHLRTWRDGWRHLRFMLLFSPRWLFLTPGLVIFLTSVLASAWLEGGLRRVGPVALDIHTLVITALMALVGYQLVVFAVFTKVFAMREGFHPPHPLLVLAFKYVTLEVGVLLGLLLACASVVGLAVAVWIWGTTGFGSLDPRVTMRVVIPASVGLALGVQTIFASFFLSILGLATNRAHAA